MFKYVYLLTLCFCLCAANDLSETGRKKGGGYLLYGTGIAYYLTFLLVKIKVIAVVGTLITLALVAGKIYAFYKYIAYAESQHHIEPIYQEIPHHDFHYGKEVYLDHSPYETDHDHSEHVVDSPPSADIHEKTYSTYPSNTAYQSNAYSSNTNNNEYPTYSSPYSSNYHARKIDNISNILDITKRIFRSLKLSELAFDAMHIKSDTCKRRFMCEAYLQAENNQILSLGLTILNDTSQEDYRPEQKVSTLEECQLMYKECEEELQS
ncbi:uncharacterized protein [Onthophagus taurus]|uniref:uncharacterized protein n=1 Tax=Onthophagus taurus TaxID=166361 RepID=UPI0039BE8FF4